jgi:hypothetical protein
MKNPQLTALHKLYTQNPILLVDGIGTQFLSALMDVSEPIKTTDKDGNSIIATDKDGNQLSNDYNDFASFVLIDADFFNYQVADYPFYNLKAAANSGMFNAKRYRYQMLMPRYQNGFDSRQKTILENLNAKLEEHVLKGGTFTLITPFGSIAGCVLDGAITMDKGAFEEINQILPAMTIPFKKVLIDLEDAQATYNQSMDRISKDLPPLPTLTEPARGMTQ